MAENGTKTITFVGSIIGGIIAVMLVVFTIVYSPLQASITKETDYRAAEDKRIEKETGEKSEKQFNSLDNKLDKILDGQMKQGERLAKIEQKIEIR